MRWRGGGGGGGTGESAGVRAAVGVDEIIRCLCEQGWGSSEEDVEAYATGEVGGEAGKCIRAAAAALVMVFGGRRRLVHVDGRRGLDVGGVVRAQRVLVLVGGGVLRGVGGADRVACGGWRKRPSEFGVGLAGAGGGRQGGCEGYLSTIGTAAGGGRGRWER